MQTSFTLFRTRRIVKRECEKGIKQRLHFLKQESNKTDVVTGEPTGGHRGTDIATREFRTTNLLL